MNLKNLVIGIAIIILTIFVTFYGINMFFPKPQYEDYCNMSKFQNVLVETQTTCADMGGIWYPQNIECIKAPCPQGYCDLYYQCNQEYNDVLKVRARNVFFVALPLGILIIALGAFVFGLESVGVGIMGGGIGTLIYGSGAYWPFSENWIRFIISLVGLIILIWIAYWFNNKFEKNKGRK